LTKEIERILRLDHAGEFGAIRIYSAQLLIAGIFYKDIVSQLEEMIAHEKEHYKIFSTLLAARSMSPFRVISFWAISGFIMGIFTAILGRKAIWVCTDAVETTVLDHLEWQLEFLKKHDLEAHAAVLSIITDEEEHQEFGRNHVSNAFIYKSISFVIKRSTAFAIWISTYV
jgi:ubiquinone biosynthesis monooxygenase Coq7